MLDESFEKIYRAFRLEYYKHFFSVLRERAGSLSAAEISSVEVIYLLNEPTMKEIFRLHRHLAAERHLQGEVARRKGISQEDSHGGRAGNSASA